MLGNLVLELHELRKQNAELTNESVKCRSLKAHCEVCNNKNNSNVDSELGSNPISSPLPSIDQLP